ncbi:MAG: guanylate kinase, partial [Elusimicrobiota bacterium]
MNEDKLLEWEMVHGYYYGTPRDFIEENLNEGKYIMLDIDVKGGMQIKEQYPESVTIFIKPPSMEELERRITDRKQDSESEIRKRLNNSKKEMEKAHDFDYVIVNNRLENALEELKCIIMEKQRVNS